MDPFVSLILPIRNEADTIARTLKSVLAQDYPAELLEVLVVDGQSTDGTPEIVTRLLEASPTQVPVRILQNPGQNRTDWS